MGSSSLDISDTKYHFRELSLSEIDKAGVQVAARTEPTLCELYLGVSLDYLLIEGAVEPSIDTVPQEFLPLAIEEFKRVNPFCVWLTARRFLGNVSQTPQESG